MKSWSIAEAEAIMSDVFDAALVSGPQKIERRGSGSVVVVAESADVFRSGSQRAYRGGRLAETQARASHW